MNILKNLFRSKDQVLYRSYSPISGKIEVKEKDGVRRLFVEGVLQSVGDNATNFFKRYWTGMVDLADKALIHPQKILLLGLGGGSVVGVLRKNFNNVRIDAVEIDSEIIKIAKNFFGISEGKYLRIIQADAYSVLSRPSNYPGLSSEYDLVIVDTYIGGKFPVDLKSDRFIRNLCHVIEKDGAVIFNRFYEPSFVREIRRFKGDLEKHFAYLDSKVIKAGISTSNILILAKDPING